MKVTSRWSVAAGVFLASAQALAQSIPPGIRFPGERTEAPNTQRTLAVAWVPPPEDSGPEHQLVLKNLTSGVVRPVRSFGRWVNVLWSPTGTHFAVTDGVGSDTTEAWVYSAQDRPPQSIWDALQGQHGRSGLAFTADAHHRYVEAQRWLTASTLLVRVWGYGGAKAFDRRLRVKIRIESAVEE